MSEAGFTFTSAHDETERNALLEQAAQELDVLSGNMGPSGMPIPTPDGDQVRSLKQDRVRFVGEQSLEPISEENVPPRQPQIIPIAQLAKEYNFYWLPIPIMLEPQSNWAYNELQVHFVLTSDDVLPNVQPKAYTIYPEVKFDTRETDIKPNVEVGVGASVGPYAKLGLEINSSIQKIKPRITHMGIGQHEAYLGITEIRTLNGDLQVAIIVQMPKASKTLKLESDMTAYHKLQFAPRRVLDVFPLLSQKVRDLFVGGVPIHARLEPPWKFDLAAKS